MPLKPRFIAIRSKLSPGVFASSVMSLPMLNTQEVDSVIFVQARLDREACGNDDTSALNFSVLGDAATAALWETTSFFNDALILGL